MGKAIAATLSLMLVLAGCSEPIDPLGSPDLSPVYGASASAANITVCHKMSTKWQPVAVNAKGVAGHITHGDFVIDETHPCPPAPILSITGDQTFDRDYFCDIYGCSQCTDCTPFSFSSIEPIDLDGDNDHNMTVTNIGYAATGQLVITLQQQVPGIYGQFSILGTTCTTLAPGQSCTVHVGFGGQQDCDGEQTAVLKASDGIVEATINLDGFIVNTGGNCSIESGELG